jgi:hypothetical protein
MNEFMLCLSVCMYECITGFLAENVILSNNREYLIKEAGESTYHGAYNLLSTLATGSILYGYIGHGRGQVCRRARS